LDKGASTRRCNPRNSKKRSEIDEIEAPPGPEKNQVVFATRTHHGEKAPMGRGEKAELKSAAG